MNDQNKAVLVLSIIHKAMLAGQILLVAVFLYLISATDYKPGMVAMNRLFQIIALVLAAAGFFAGRVLFKNKIAQLKDKQSAAKDKFIIYRSVCIVQWALLEGPCIFSGVAFFLTGNYAFLGLAIVLITLFALRSPSKNKVTQDLGLTDQEIADL